MNIVKNKRSIADAYMANGWRTHEYCERFARAIDDHID